MTDETTQVGPLDGQTPPTEPVTPPETPPEPPTPSPQPEPTPDTPKAAVLSANIGAEQAPDIGSGSVLSPVSETSLQTDHVITDHDDPEGRRFQFLGASPAVPLPLAGAGGNALKPEEAFRAAGQ